MAEIIAVDGSTCAAYCDEQKECCNCGIQKAVDRLFAYESTNKTPEEVVALQAEISSLTAELKKSQQIVDKYASSARVIALYLKDFCNDTLPYDEMISDAARKAEAELEQVKADRDAAIVDLYERCGICKTYVANGGTCMGQRSQHCFKWKWRGPCAEGGKDNG
jgi:uncharacterized small protein (DUF1192 family)